MRILALSLLLAALVAVSSAANDAAFEVVCLHDVVDSRSQLDPDSITSSDLIAFLEWLRYRQWTIISLDDVERASKGIAELPPHPILIIIDDGYLSAYTRVFPLLLAYKAPAVMALVGSWMDGTASSGRPQISWDQAREMQRSGLVEFSSHSYDLHHGIIGNPQGNELPAAAYRKYDPVLGYENDDTYRERVTADLEHSIEQMKRELGRAPRSLTWPYGRYTTIGQRVAIKVGFTYTFNLDPEPAFVGKPIGMGRHYLTSENLVEEQKRLFEVRLPVVQRLVHINPADIWSPDAAQTDERLGKAIERLRVLGATAVVIDAVEEDSQGRVIATWFPNSQGLPMRADVLLRISWQMHRRAGVVAYGSLPVKPTLEALGGDRSRTLALYRDFAVHDALEGMFFEHTPGLAALKTQATDNSGAAWDVRRRRDAVDTNSLSPLDAFTLLCFHTVEVVRRDLKLALANQLSDNNSPSAIADLSLVIVPDKPEEVRKLQKEMRTLGWFQPMFARRFGLWIESPAPPAPGNLSTITRRFEREGGAVIGWGTDDPIGNRPPAAQVAPSVSASTFPVRF
jgi:poly-beta-1,6-N-acetyl-D-glucosamine N-deacetylase